MSRPLAVYFAVGLLLSGARLVAGCNVLTPADRLAIAADAVRIEVCQQKGRDAMHDTDSGDAGYVTYNACIVDAGFRGAK